MALINKFRWVLLILPELLSTRGVDIGSDGAFYRNSAVMGVIEPWRPQIFYSSGTLKGQPVGNPLIYSHLHLTDSYYQEPFPDVG